MAPLFLHHKALNKYPIQLIYAVLIATLLPGLLQQFCSGWWAIVAALLIVALTVAWVRKGQELITLSPTQFEYALAIGRLKFYKIRVRFSSWVFVDDFTDFMQDEQVVLELYYGYPDDDLVITIPGRKRSLTFSSFMEAQQDLTAIQNYLKAVGQH